MGTCFWRVSRRWLSVALSRVMRGLRYLAVSTMYARSHDVIGRDLTKSSMRQTSTATGSIEHVPALGQILQPKDICSFNTAFKSHGLPTHSGRCWPILSDCSVWFPAKSYTNHRHLDRFIVFLSISVDYRPHGSELDGTVNTKTIHIVITLF
jgi:hypothetical protein